MNCGFSKRFCIVSLYENSLPKLRLKLQYILISYIFQRILYKMEKMNRVSAFKLSKILHVITERPKSAVKIASQQKASK